MAVEQPLAAPENAVAPAPLKIETVYQQRDLSQPEAQDNVVEMDNTAAPRKSSRVVDNILKQIAGELLGEQMLDEDDQQIVNQSPELGAPDAAVERSAAVEQDRQARRERSGRCLVCGRHLGASAKLLKLKYCRKHYFNHT